MADPTADLERLRAIAEKMTPGKRAVRRDPTLELRCKAVSYQYEYEPGEFASVWLAREMKDADAEALATFDRETLLALLARTDGDDGWQPIETAPKGGKWVLAYWPDVCEVPFDAYEVDGRWHAAPGGDCWGSSPTHWRPLPAGPIPPDPRRTT